MIGAGIRAGKAFVEFVIGDKKLDGQMARIGKRLTKLGSIGVAATAPILGGFAAAVLTFSSVAGSLDDLSNRTGVSVEKLSELKFAAEQNDATVGDLEKAFQSLQQKGIDPARFDEIAADIASIEDPTKRADAAMTLFGKRAGSALLPMIMELPEAERRAREMAVTLSTEDAVAAGRFGEALDASKAQLTSLAVQIGAAIAGPLTEFLTWSQGMVAGVIEFVKENPNMVVAIAATTAAIAAVSAAAVIFGTILTIISLHPIIAALALIAGLVVGVATYFGLASGSAGDFKKSLDGVKLPGAPGGASPFAGQASQAQAQLQSALAGRTVAPTATMATAAGSSAQAISDQFGGVIAANTKATAEGIRELIQIARFNPTSSIGGALAYLLP